MASLRGAGITSNGGNSVVNIGAARRARFLYGRANSYTVGAEARMKKGGATGMAAHRSGLQAAGLSGAG